MQEIVKSLPISLIQIHYNNPTEEHGVIYCGILNRMGVSWDVNKTLILVICLEKWMLLAICVISYVYFLVSCLVDKNQQSTLSPFEYVFSIWDSVNQQCKIL